MPLGPKAQAYIARAAQEIADIEVGMGPYAVQVQQRVLGTKELLAGHLAAVDDPASPLYLLSDEEKAAWRVQIQSILDNQAAFVSGFYATYFA